MVSCHRNEKVAKMHGIPINRPAWEGLKDDLAGVCCPKVPSLQPSWPHTNLHRGATLYEATQFNDWTAVYIRQIYRPSQTCPPWPLSLAGLYLEGHGYRRKDCVEPYSGPAQTLNYILTTGEAHALCHQGLRPSVQGQLHIASITLTP